MKHRPRIGSRVLAQAFGLAFAACLPTGLEARPFSDIVCLGDSLSDVGRFYQASGGAFPPPPYHEGRFCNGPVWNEYLAEQLSMELDPERQHALGGSLTGNLNYQSIPPSFILPGFEQQVDEVIVNGKKAKISPKALYTVWIGANDFFAWLGSGSADPAPMMVEGVANTIDGITELSDAGARHFVVINLPDLGKTPTAIGLGPQASGLLSFLSASYNEMLDGELDELAENRRLRITRVDAFGLINDMVANPEDYGFSNVTQQGLGSPAGSCLDEYLFWDGVHPTTAAQQFVAELVMEGLRDEYRSLRGNGARRMVYRAPRPQAWTWGSSHATR